jgi:UDP-N-acetylglucosamine diphosphorylase / glucose-1-phosphate thymidylyltransferase / UDP-N-acetylgalactosamine diphosphorylase / glucosamine-1-phosphate N-acetyltransferase / galactosamine-1-phosphate N-acetyltransferase
VGNSVLGPWVNLGAGTITSNLKNTYGPVRLEVRETRIETGRLNLGALFGDHAKTAIGTMLATGTVISAGANVFGAAPPKYVPPFSWGAHGTERLSEEGFLRVAERVLGRRNVEFTAVVRRSLQQTYSRGTCE